MGNVWSATMQDDGGDCYDSGHDASYCLYHCSTLMGKKSTTSWDNDHLVPLVV